MKTTKYRATLRMLCDAHGSHEVRLYSDNDCLAALTADSEARRLAALGHECVVIIKARDDDGEWETISLEEAVSRDLGDDIP